MFVTVSCKMMKLWHIKVCQHPGQNHNAYVEIECFVISVLSIWLFPTETSNLSFYSFSHVLLDSRVNSVQVRCQNLTSLVITEKYTSQAAINGPNTFWPKEIVVWTLK